MKILLHQNWEEMRSLSERWNHLLRDSASDTIFLTWEWIAAWWKNYASDRPLLVLSAWEGDSLEGLAPFYLDRLSSWGKTCTCLKLLGDGSRDSDYLDCIARRGREQEVIGAFIQYLESQAHHWDCLELHGTPENSPCLAELIRLARRKSWWVSQTAIPCATLSLPRDWNDYLRMLRPRFRTKVRSTLSYFEDKVGTIPAPCRDSRDVEPWLAILFELHARRWQRTGQPGVFRDVAKQNFYRDVSQAALQRGWLAFHRLDWGGRPVAMQFGFAYNNRFFLLQEGYDPEFATLRPGLALRSWLIRHWIKTGLAQYDFLAGTAAHKLEWGTELTQSVRLTLAPSWHAAWVSFGAAHAREKAKQAVCSVVPDRILAWRRARRAGPNLAAGGMSSPNGQTRSWGRRVAAAVYASTPLGAVGRAITTRYELDLPRHMLHRRRLPICQIFIYHRVNDDYDLYFPSLPIAAFRKQMEFLTRHFPVVSLDEIARGSFGQTKESYCIAITFDDGYRDNFLHAFPVLKELQVPATIFLTTGSVECGEPPWYDQISWAFKLTTERRLSIGPFGSSDASLDGRTERLEALRKSLAWLRGVGAAERQQIIPRLLEALHVPAPLALPNPMLSWDEIRQMAKQKITFGAHTVSHPSLAGLSVERLHAEIVGSKNKIEEKLQIPVRHFAYPFGQRSDIGAEAKRTVQQAGFLTAVTTIWGFNRPGEDLFELKRFSPRFNPWDFHPGIFAMMLDWYRLSGLHAS